MAKRNNAGRLAGLAGLAALGYMALKGKGESAPVEDQAGKPTGEYDPIASGDWSYGEQGMMAKEPGGGSSVAPPKAAASAGGPDERYMAGASAPLPKGTPTDKKYLASRDMQRKVESGITAKAETDAETARLLSRFPMKKAQGLPPDVDPSSAFRGARSPQNQADSAAARYFRGKLDRGETLNETEKAQARRAGITGFKKGGAVKVKKMASGGMTTSSASKRADGIATKGKTRGKMY